MPHTPPIAPKAWDRVPADVRTLLAAEFARKDAVIRLLRRAVGDQLRSTRAPGPERADRGQTVWVNNGPPLSVCYSAYDGAGNLVATTGEITAADGSDGIGPEPRDGPDEPFLAGG